MPLKLLLLLTIGCGRQRKLKIESLLANILVKKSFNVPSFLSFSLWLFSVYILWFPVSSCNRVLLKIPFFTGWPVTEDELKEAALHSGVLSVEDDFLDATFRSKCEEIIPYPNQVQPNECKDAFLHLKEKFMEL